MGNSYNTMTENEKALLKLVKEAREAIRSSDTKTIAQLHWLTSFEKYQDDLMEKAVAKDIAPDDSFS
jgi:hypothetical protein